MGGEKIASCTVCRVSMGSPPHGRGKEHAAPAGHTAAGITPAWAGKSSAQPRSGPPGQDHPRVGGEKDRKPTWNVCAVGSPPRRRGKVVCAGLGPVSRRITPAWAGKSVCGPRFCRLDRDHPRVGGEKSQESLQGQTTLGSPPRGRGKVQQGQPVGLVNGITPAWAGKSGRQKKRRTTC